MPPLHTRRQPYPLRRPTQKPRRSLDRLLRRGAVALDPSRLKPLRHLVAMKPRLATLVIQLAPDIPRQVARSQARFAPFAGADWQAAQQLDVHEAATPRLLDQPPRHEPPDRQVDVKPVPARMPLRHPQIRQSRRPDPVAQAAEERPDVGAKLRRLVTTLTRIGQRPEPIQPIRRSVTADLRLRPTPRLRRRPLRIRPPTRRLDAPRNDKAAPTLARLRVERERPTSLHRTPPPSRKHLTRRPPGRVAAPPSRPRSGVKPPSVRFACMTGHSSQRLARTLSPQPDGAPGTPPATPSYVASSSKERQARRRRARGPPSGLAPPAPAPADPRASPTSIRTLDPHPGCRGPPRPNRRPPPSSLRSSAIWASPRHPRVDQASTRILAQPSVDDFELVILPKPPSAFPATGSGRSSSASRCGSCPWAARS
jgi:hypothetical protein